MSFYGLPLGAIEAIKTTYGTGFQILDPPKDGFSLTLKLNFSKVTPDEELLTKVASIREVVMGAPLKIILKHLASRRVAPELDRLVAIMHRPNETFFLVSQADKVTVAFPMRFRDSVDTILATSFLKARRIGQFNYAPSCSWSPTAPQDLEGAPTETLSANADFVTFVILPRHVEGNKLDRTVWNLSTFHAYVSYHVKCTEGFMHTRMRRRVESMIQALDKAKPLEKTSSINNKSFKRLDSTMSITPTTSSFIPILETSVNGTDAEHNVTVSAEETLRNIVNETAPATDSESLHDVETTKRVFLEAEKKEEEEEVKTKAEPRLDAKEKEETKAVKTVVEEPEIVTTEETTSHESESLKGEDHQRDNTELVEAIKNSEDAEQISTEVTVTQKTEEVLSQ